MLFIILGGIHLFFPRCANIIPPTGGPRDTIPPEVVISTPPNFSTGFQGSLISIEFDEFIQLRNINQQFIITPPQKERPEFRVRGTDLQINLNTEPLPNTTYTLNFGNAITDLNEGNILSNFEFVFSTGDKIDSLSYSGIVLNAFDNMPVEGVVVMLYNELHDSVPFRQLPVYANRTAKDGRFMLNYLRTDTFKVFVLADENNNYLYDRPGDESIAFPDNFIFPDTIQTENQKYIPADNDTLNPEVTPDDYPDEPENLTDAGIVLQFPGNDTLYLFFEETGRQYIRESSRRHRGELLFVFNQPLQKEWSFEPVDFEPSGEWKILEQSRGRDTIILWITDQETRERDNMRFAISYRATGPSDSLNLITDSVNMNYMPPQLTRRQASATDPEPEVMAVNFGISPGGSQDLHRNLLINFQVPVESIDLSKTVFGTVNENRIETRDFELIRDSIKLRSYHLVTEWLPGENYKFFAEPGAFRDVFGLITDSIDFTFTAKEEEGYGRILLNIMGVDTHKIIQLLGGNDRILREYFIENDGEIIIDYLNPADYGLKLIVDSNNNKKWDTGNYLLGIQPERVFLHKEKVTVRPNWDIEVDWDLKN